MATWYVDSTATGGTGVGTSWANACLTLAAAIALSAAGDDFDVYNGHAETQASALTLTFKGTPASPNRVFSCDRTNSPAQASDLLAGASVTTTGTNAITISGIAYIYGVTFNNGTGTTAASFVLGSTTSFDLTFDTCQLKNNITTNASSFVTGTPGANISARITLINTPFFFAGASSSNIQVNSQFIWKNTPSAVQGASAASLTNLFSGGVRPTEILCDGCDFSGMGSGKSLVGTPQTSIYFQFLNCKLAANAAPAGTGNASGYSVDLINSDSGATGYRNERYQYAGALTTETTVILIGGASDGVQPISWKVVNNANAKRIQTFDCFQVSKWWGTALGSSHSITYQIYGPSGLTNADVWVDVEYLGSAATPISSLASSAPATQLTAGSALTTATSVWGGVLGLQPYTITVSFTPQIAGFVRSTVRFAKASTTIYVDPDPVIV